MCSKNYFASVFTVEEEDSMPDTTWKLKLKQGQVCPKAIYKQNNIYEENRVTKPQDQMVSKKVGENIANTLVIIIQNLLIY